MCVNVYGSARCCELWGPQISPAQGDGRPHRHHQRLPWSRKTRARTPPTAAAASQPFPVGDESERPPAASCRSPFVESGWRFPYQERWGPPSARASRLRPPQWGFARPDHFHNSRHRKELRGFVLDIRIDAVPDSSSDVRSDRSGFIPIRGNGFRLSPPFPPKKNWKREPPAAHYWVRTSEQGDRTDGGPIGERRRSEPARRPSSGSGWSATSRTGNSSIGS